MIHYYTNREIAEKLKINLARWKRWSRSFLPPDPLGGMQSGYARQYAFKDVFKVFLGGHLISHLKLSVTDSRRVMADLAPWFKKNGFTDLDATNRMEKEAFCRKNSYRIYFSPFSPSDSKRRLGFEYLIRKTVNIETKKLATGFQIIEKFEEKLIFSDQADGFAFLSNPYVRLINLTVLLAALIEMLYPQPEPNRR